MTKSIFMMDRRVLSVAGALVLSQVGVIGDQSPERFVHEFSLRYFKEIR
jgi:hypothetical protein